MHAEWVRWKNRRALRLDNGSLEMVVLAGGGHFADLRIRSGSNSSPNLMWESPWLTADPGSEEHERLSPLYGGSPAGPFLAGYTGHILCLDTFGPPSPEQEARGISLHGEAPNRMWTLRPTVDGCLAKVQLPASQLAFTRTMRAREGQGVLFVEETLENLGAWSREVHWVQHVSLGPPFLAGARDVIEASADRCRSWPEGYEDRPLLPNQVDFTWPFAPTCNGETTDLRRPFQHQGTGFLAAARVAEASAIGWIVALNARSGWALVYCFRRDDFPWIAVWEENGARHLPPWNGSTSVRGMEFGTTPMPLGLKTIAAMGSLFDTPVAAAIPAGGKRLSRYAIAAAPIPDTFTAVDSVAVSDSLITLTGPANACSVVMAADGIGKFLTEESNAA